jgi:hypothetical protein
MRPRNQIRLITLLSLVSACGLSAAPACNPKDLQGSYGFQLSGTTTISGNPKPVANVGRIVLDGHGKVSGQSSVMFAGYLLGNPVTGTYEARENCTVDWGLQDDSGAFQHFSGVMTEDGRRVQFRQTDPGGAKRGIMIRTPDQCTVRDLRKKYTFRLSGNFTPMLEGEAPASVEAKGKIEADENGQFHLTREDIPAVKTDVTITMEPECIVHLETEFPDVNASVTPMKLRGVLVDEGKSILAIRTDPGWMVPVLFTAD